MLADFEILKNPPRLQFLIINCDIPFEDKHFEIIKILRLTYLVISGQIKNLEKFKELKELRILDLRNFSDSNIDQLVNLENLFKLNIIFKEPYPNFEFLSNMKNLEYLGLYFETKKQFSEAKVRTIARIPELTSLIFKNISFENLQYLEGCKNIFHFNKH